MRTTIKRAVLACSGLLMLAGCAVADENSGAPVAGSARGTTLPAAPTEDNAGAGGLVAPIELASSQACTISRMSLTVAMEAFQAETGVSPASEAEIVAAGYIMEESTLHDLQPGGIVVDTPLCQGGGAPGEPIVVTPEQQCEIDQRALMLAIDTFRLDNADALPTSEAQLVGVYLDEDLANFDVAPDGSVVKSPASTC